MNTRNIESADTAGLALAEQVDRKVTTSVRRKIASTELLAGGHELQIEHYGAVYTLRQTSKGKLILTK